MAEEPNNLVLQLSREIRAKLDAHDQKSMSNEQQLKDIHESMTFALGLSAHANVRHETVQKELTAIKTRLDRIERQRDG